MRCFLFALVASFASARVPSAAPTVVPRPTSTPSLAPTLLADHAGALYRGGNTTAANLLMYRYCMTHRAECGGLATAGGAVSTLIVMGWCFVCYQMGRVDEAAATLGRRRRHADVYGMQGGTTTIAVALPVDVQHIADDQIEPLPQSGDRSDGGVQVAVTTQPLLAGDDSVPRLQPPPVGQSDVATSERAAQSQPVRPSAVIRGVVNHG